MSVPQVRYDSQEPFVAQKMYPDYESDKVTDYAE